MQVYDAPLRDMRFVLDELFADDGFGAIPRFAAWTPDVTAAILDASARTARALLPLNASGDAEGCTLQDGAVRTPAGFRDAYARFVAAGWPALAADPRWGGQGAPEAVSKLCKEMICAANLSFSLYPGLTGGVAAALARHGSDALKERWLPALVSGACAGTMCLTEAQSGSDLGLLRARAVPGGDGTFRVTGAKIFISAGDHDLTDNIVHLVLARLPDAPPGTKGISLFLIPKFLPGADGGTGARNGVTVTGIERKMGLHAAATCQLGFDDAVGWLVGEPNRGLPAMFTMMNAARLSVGMQGLGLAEIAYQSAVAYARTRLQGRATGSTQTADAPADPIIVHPDVRRMLMTMRASAEGCRALGQWIARALDAEAHHPDPAVRARAADLVALVTPVVKALFGDLGHEAAQLGIQVHGGHGYIRDHGVEQFGRDARIAMLYEGTNGVQALDLVRRKLPAHDGRLLRTLLEPVASLIAATERSEDEALRTMTHALGQALGALRDATAAITDAPEDADAAGAAAADYLRLIGLVAIGYCFLKAATIAQARVAQGHADADFYRAKIVTARFFFDRILPHAAAAAAAIAAGKRSTMALPADAF